MHYSRVALVATPLLFAYVSAYGNAIIKNSCGEDVYFWSCGDQPGQMITVSAGQSYTQGYYSKSGGGGPSLKVGIKYPTGPKQGEIPGINDQPAPNMTQFEYTVGTPGPPDKHVFYDISNINGYPFMPGGVKMTSSDGSVNVACPKGVEYCTKAYNAPHDDHATGSAPENVDLTLELCSEAPGMVLGGGSSGSSGSSGGSNGGSGGGSEEVSTTPQPSSSTPVVTSSPQTSQSQHDGSQQGGSQQGGSQQGGSQPQVAAPEKLEVNAPAQEADTTTTATTSSITPPPDNVVVWQTVTAAPVIVTVHQKEKRHEHIHQHVHNKINKKRHDN